MAKKAATKEREPYPSEVADTLLFRFNPKLKGKLQKRMPLHGQKALTGLMNMVLEQWVIANPLPGSGK